MGNKKKLPQGLAEKQELQRQETINKVLRAAADIKSEGGEVTISVLREYTGLSRSTFAKPHIRELLQERGCTAKGIVPLSPRYKQTQQDEIILGKDRQITELKAKNEELERECELLRGRLFLAIQNTKFAD